MSAFSLFKKIFEVIRRSNKQIDNLAHVAIDDYISNHLMRNPRYDNPGSLSRHEFQIYSQHGEDGIIAEIFRRIGVTNRAFVEFGVGDGLENNTVNLLSLGWSGLWIEADSNQVNAIRREFNEVLTTEQLKLFHSFITTENIERLFRDANVSTEPDIMSIDIDGNDYWIWKAIENYSPRVLVIEYNAMYPPDREWVMKYNPNAVWKEDTNFGASLKSYELLGRDKGYCLVGCDFTGVNAFFVRNDLVENRFCAPFTSENHYEPIRFFLNRKLGYRRVYGG